MRRIVTYDKPMLAFRYIVIGVILSVGASSHAQEPSAIKSIYFGGGSFYIDEMQSEELSQFIAKHLSTGQFNITVHSHTDDIGGAEYNAWLSQMRSETVIQKLIESLIEREAIQIKDFGQFNPVYDNSTWEGRFKNRRVDVILWPIVL